MQAYYFTLFDQKVRCDFPILEAIPIEPVDQPDIIIEEGIMPENILQEIQKGKYDSIGQERAWFYVKDHLIFLVTDGNHILIQTVGEDDDHVAKSTFLTGVGMAICMTQKGLVPIHGGAVCVKDRGFIITGTSGSGKSSTTTKVRERGAVFMADDIGTVDADTLELLPGFPVQKLCGDMIDHLGMNRDEMRFIGEARDKYAKSLDDGQYLYERRPLAAIFEIVRDSGDELRMEEVTGADCLKTIVNNIFCIFYVKNLPMTSDSMMKYLKIAQNIKIYRIRRPEGRDTLQEITDWVWDRMNQE